MDTISADGDTDCLEDFLSVVVVSPSCSAHPDTTLIEKSIRSLHRLTGSKKRPMITVLDELVIHDTSRHKKKGQTTDAMSK